MTSIGVIIPTVVRESLWAAVSSVATQLGPDDYLQIVVDVPDFDDLDRAIFGTNLKEATVGCLGGVDWFWNPEPLGGHGHPSRNLALERCPFGFSQRATHVWSIDDDDVALAGAIDAIRKEVANAPLRWYAFQTRFGPGSHAAGVTVWRDRTVRLGDIGTPCIVAPVGARSRWGSLGVDQFGRDYGAGYFGDFRMAQSLEAELGPPVWVPVEVCEARP